MSEQKRATPGPGSVWKHCRTGNFYEVIGLAKYVSGPGSGEGMRDFVVYRSQEDGRLWLRDVADFLAPTESGVLRFTEVIE